MHSNNVSRADNQQETKSVKRRRVGSSETTRQAPSVAVCKAYLQGALHDGTFNKYNQRHRFSQSGTDWLYILKECLANAGHTSWIYKEGAKRKVYILETKADFLNIDFDPISLNSLEERKVYIRGFFDADGGIPRNPTARFYVQLVQNGTEKLEKLKIMLTDMGITTGKIHNPSSRIDPDYFRMFVLTDSHMKFVKEISSWHPRKIRTLRKRRVVI